MLTYKYGIDYGTTNSSIAITTVDESGQHTRVVNVEDSLPKTVLPSKVLISNNKYLVGRSRTKSDDVNNIVRAAKTFLEPKDADLKPKAYVTINGYRYKLSWLIAAVLKQLRLKAEPIAEARGVKMDGVVMGVPVEYGNEQKDILLEALVQAGFYQTFEEATEKTMFVSEPLAVAVDYGEKITNNTTVMVFDFGGGTLDIVAMNLKKDIAMMAKDKLHPHDVIAKERGLIGGELMTKAFFVNGFFKKGKYSLDQFSKAFALGNVSSPVELWNSIMALGKEGDLFFEAVDKLKCDLSVSELSNFEYQTRTGYLKPVKFFDEEFEAALKVPLPGDEISAFSIIENTVNKILENSQIDGIKGIDKVILAGGSSNIPCVQKMLMSKFMGQMDSKIDQLELLTSIARGLSIVGCQEKQVIDDVVDNSYGFWDVKEDCFVEVIKKGVKVKDTEFVQKQKKGQHIDFVNNNPNSTRMEIEIYQSNQQGDLKLGTIKLTGTDDRKYRLFMSVDKKKGYLHCYFLDTEEGTWLDEMGKVSLDQCEIKLT